MPRYFFHLEDSVLIEDCEGNELPDDAAALRTANMLAMRLSDHEKFGSWCIVIENEMGKKIAAVPTNAGSNSRARIRH